MVSLARDKRAVRGRLFAGETNVLASEIRVQISITALKTARNAKATKQPICTNAECSWSGVIRTASRLLCEIFEISPIAGYIKSRPASRGDRVAATCVYAERARVLRK